MTAKVLHQFVAGASPGDAITDQAFLIRDWLRELEFSSDVFSEHVHTGVADQVKPLGQLRLGSENPWLIVHHSIGVNFGQDLAQHRPKIILIYHNVTPPAYFSASDPARAESMLLGRRQLPVLRPFTRLALADSSYNEAELLSLGFDTTGVLPIALDESDYQWPLSDGVANKLGRKQRGHGGPILLFVGRLSPNKRQEDLLKFLYYYRRIQPTARLLLVGERWMPAYGRWLGQLAQSLKLVEAVTMTGFVTQEELVSFYRLSDLYLSMSEHEGFGKPLIESMYLGLPVMAYRSTAVPGTMGDAGILFSKKDFEALAEVVDILLNDSGMQDRLLRRQKDRAEKFLEPRIRERFHGYLDEVGLL